MTKDTAVRIDMSRDVQQVHATGLVWRFPNEARDRSLIRRDATVIAAGDEDPVGCQISSGRRRRTTAA